MLLPISQLPDGRLELVEASGDHFDKLEHVEPAVGVVVLLGDSEGVAWHLVEASTHRLLLLG